MDINTNGVNTSSYQHLEVLLDQHGQWNVDLLKHMFPQNVVTKLLTILPPNGNSGRYICCWPNDKKGEYTILSSYKFTCNFDRKMERIIEADMEA